MPPAPPPPYDLACPCGARLRGARQARHQVVRCPACGTGRFVLPASPLPEAEPPRAAAAGRRRWPWLVAGAALISGLVLVGVLIALWRPAKPQAALTEPGTSEERWQELMADGRAALAEGAYLRATRQFDAALAVGEQLGRPAAQRRRAMQLHRQAALLADLLAESPAEIVRHAAGLPEAEWQELFRRRYAGRSLVLDDTITRGADGRHRISFRIPARGGAARFDLDSLRVLRDLPLAQPQRLLLGLRLAGLGREPAGWVFVPEPDSGVLLTDPEVFAGLSLPADAGVREVLKRQRAWLDLP